MKHIERDPEWPNGLLSAKGIENTNNEPNFSNDGPYAFRAYKAENVKKKLNVLFQGKCAYCESRYASIHPVDIEHWRPKAKVVNYDNSGNEVETPGYPWLAADWNNLFSSCIDCNRERWHEVTTENGERERVRCGKGNRFPLDEDSQRLAWGEDPVLHLDKEKPLLLNPCVDKPEKHLKFKFDDSDEASMGVLVPANDSTKGAVSIEVYALNRSELVLDRKARLFEIMRHIYLVQKIFQVMASLQKDSATYLLLDELLESEFDYLKKYQNPDQPFTLLARQLIAKHLKPPTIGEIL